MLKTVASVLKRDQWTFFGSHVGQRVMATIQIDLDLNGLNTGNNCKIAQIQTF